LKKTSVIEARVIAVDSLGERITSKSVIEKQAFLDVPKPMAAPYVRHKSDSDLFICWNNIAGVDKYDVTWGAKPGSETQTRTVSTTCTTVPVDRTKKQYGFIVRASNGCGSGEYSPALLVNLVHKSKKEKKYLNHSSINQVVLEGEELLLTSSLSPVLDGFLD